jgi:hypothetical protein
MREDLLSLFEYSELQKYFTLDEIAAVRNDTAPEKQEG